jgi:3-deoxy-manno-octulosonate cytidylyltransferase (CMP-KDO synthetase)
VSEHESGSDRIAVKQLKTWMSILWSMCKDEPLSMRNLAKLIETLGKIHKQVDLASLMREIKDEDEINNPIM